MPNPPLPNIICEGRVGRPSHTIDSGPVPPKSAGLDYCSLACMKVFVFCFISKVWQSWMRYIKKVSIAISQSKTRCMAHNYESSLKTSVVKEHKIHGYVSNCLFLTKAQILQIVCNSLVCFMIFTIQVSNKVSWLQLSIKCWGSLYTSFFFTFPKQICADSCFNTSL